MVPFSLIAIARPTRDLLLGLGEVRHAFQPNRLCRADEVAVMLFSQYDHGTADPMFVVGKKGNPGLHGSTHSRHAAGMGSAHMLN